MHKTFNCITTDKSLLPYEDQNKKKSENLVLFFFLMLSPAYHRLTINILWAQFLACPRLLVIGRGSLEQASLIFHLEACVVKAGVNVKAVFTSLNTVFLPISRSRFKRRQIPMLITLSTIWQFCVNIWVIFRCFGKERFFLKG